MNCFNNFTFSNSFATADYTTIQIVCSNFFCFFSRSHAGKSFFLRQFCFEVSFFSCTASFNDCFSQHFCHSRSSSQARRLHTCSIIQTVNLFRSADNEITGTGNSTQACKFSNSCTHRQIRNQFTCRSHDFVHTLGSNCMIFLRFLFISIRTNEGIAMSSSANQNTFRFFSRAGEYYTIN